MVAILISSCRTYPPTPEPMHAGARGTLSRILLNTRIAGVERLRHPAFRIRIPKARHIQYVNGPAAYGPANRCPSTTCSQQTLFWTDDETNF